MVLGHIFRRTPGNKTAALIVVDGLTQAMAFDFLSSPNTFLVLKIWPVHVSS